MPGQNANIVRAWMRSLNDGDLDAAVALCDPAFEMVESATLPGAARVSGFDALRSYALGWRRNWSEWKWIEEEIVEIGPEQVLLTARLWLRGLRSGLAVERRWAYVFVIRDGKLLRQDGYDDEAEARRALGIEARPAD